MPTPDDTTPRQRGISPLPHRHQWRDAVVFSTDARIDAYGLAVATALHVHMDPEGRCTVGLRRLAGIARCSVNTVRARLGALVDAGWLAVDGSDRERATYRAVIPAVEAPDETPVAVSPEPASVSPEGAICVTRRHTYPLNPLNPPQRSSRSSGGWHDPSVGRPTPGRPLPPVGRVDERDDGTLWVTL